MSKFSEAIKRLAELKKLKVIIIKDSAGIPEVPEDGNFKYSGFQDGLGLGEVPERMLRGENLIVILVEEEQLIGYGIASLENDKSKIEIIDVDLYSRRLAGLALSLQVNDEVFHVGVGHLIGQALMNECPRPIWVDATTKESRYIFLSIGFVHDDTTSNPCILEAV